MSESLLFFSYASNATPEFNRDELALLLASSRLRNAADDITGLLLYRGGNFIQALEGPEAAVRATVARIERDPRHAGIIPLFEGPIEQRVFGEWQMAFDDLTDLERVQAGASDFLMSAPLEQTGEHDIFEFFRSFREHMR